MVREVVLASCLVLLPSLAMAKEKCIASVYSSGGKTASGERFNPRVLAAAHKRHRFGTMLRVVNMMTGRHTDVRVNDRGPFVRGRCLDLTPAAAAKLGLGMSIAPVVVEVLENE